MTGGWLDVDIPNDKPALKSAVREEMLKGLAPNGSTFNSRSWEVYSLRQLVG